MLINYKEIELKWQKAWEEAKVFEAEPNEKESIMITSAIPYVNSPPHMGHLRTYGTPDTFARYMRMRGFNVLFPFGFHATGTPVIGYAKRIANNDKDLIDALHVFHVPDEDIAKMVDPEYIAKYFIKQQEKELRRAGFGIDWRRKFITTEPMFSKLVEWQFYRLKDKGYLVQGTHPVGWCPNENNAVGQHDTLHDVQPDIEEIVAVKFKESGSDVSFPCATYRPETIYGVTNIFINTDVEYVIAKVDGARYYLSKDAAFRLSFQYGVEVEGAITPDELLKKKAVNPLTKEEVPVLPGYFVKGTVGTGVVMSVPSHAPFDYVALERLKAQGYAVPDVEYKKLIELRAPDNKGIGRTVTHEELKGKTGQVLHPEIPALAYLELLNAASPSADDTAIEFATKLAYREEARHGIMLVGAYKGKKEPEARDGLKADLVKSGDAFTIYILANSDDVVCRCKTKVVVNIVKNQWFINYGDQAWKKQVHSLFAGVKVYPEKLRHTFETLIDWIDLRATERAQGLGTRFPFAPEHIIESLSDSTIYMVYYTFDHILRTNNVTPEQLKPEFFDYVIDSKGDSASVAKLTGIDEMAIKRCKESFEYWYKNTMRQSGPDLVPNHLIMYMFNHAALLPEKFYPKRIVVNGMVDYEGEKMSKSLGNIVPMGDGVEKYGSDPVRFMVVAGAELETNTEFNTDALNGIIARNEFINSVVSSLDEVRGMELEHIDYWLYSKLNSKISRATLALDEMRIRDAYTDIYYNSITELKWYSERGGRNQQVLRDYLEALTLMMAPIMPHVAEELWHNLGRSTMVVKERWPDATPSMVNESTEAIEDMVRSTIDDISNVIELTGKIPANKGKKPSVITIIVASEWKKEAYNMLAKGHDISAVVSHGIKDVSKQELSKFLSLFSKRINSLVETMFPGSDEIYNGFVSSREYIQKKFGARIMVEKEGESKSPRAGRATPGKPSIEVVYA